MKKRTALIALRIRHNLTQEQIAERLEVTRGAYSQIELGTRDGRFDFWQRLQKEFNLTDSETWAILKNEDGKQKETRQKVYN